MICLSRSTWKIFCARSKPKVLNCQLLKSPFVPPKNFRCGLDHAKRMTIVDDPIKALSEGYRRVVQAYINVGAYDIGLGDVGDETSWYNYLSPGTNAALFDTQWKPKMGWYEILKVMYDGFFK